MKDTPVESTLRLGYVDKCYIDTVNEIKKKFEGKKIWISMDETTDVEKYFKDLNSYRNRLNQWRLVL